YYERQVESSVSDLVHDDWRVTININPGKPVLVAHIDVRGDGPGENDPLFHRILRHLPLHDGERLKHAAYESIKTDLQRTAATYGYLDARLIRNELVIDPPNRKANIALELDTGERYHFGATSISQGVVREALVRRYLRYQEGDPFDLTQVTRYSLQSRYNVPIGDPAVEKLTLAGTVEQRQLADVTTHTFSLGPSITEVTGSWQHVWLVTAMRTTSDLPLGAELFPGAHTDRLLVPGVDLASVPKGYLGEALFEHPFFAELRGSHAALGSDANFIQL